MKSLFSTVSRLKRFLIEVNTFPLGRRIGAYVILFIGLLLGISSSVVCLLGIWGLITAIFDGTFPPYIDPEDSEWDIR